MLPSMSQVLLCQVKFGLASELDYLAPTFKPPNPLSILTILLVATRNIPSLPLRFELDPTTPT